MDRDWPLDVSVRPIFQMAEQVPAGKDIADIHVFVLDQKLISIAQSLKRPAKHIVLVKIVFPDKVGIWTGNRNSLPWVLG